MKSKKEELVQSILMILKIDARNLFDRIKNRKKEYLLDFSLKRKREHFQEIFQNKYQGITVKDLKYCGTDVLVALDQFYTCVDELRWYLNHTQDMINMTDDKIEVYIRQLKKKLEVLDLYIDGELGISSFKEQPQIEEVVIERVPEVTESDLGEIPSENFLDDSENS